jgi:hypothetical protein
VDGHTPGEGDVDKVERYLVLLTQLADLSDNQRCDAIIHMSEAERQRGREAERKASSPEEDGCSSAVDEPGHA